MEGGSGVVKRRYLTIIDEILSRLANVCPSDSGWTSLCPSHCDTRASLSIGWTTEGVVLLFCHAGCGVDEIVDAVGLEVSDLYSRLPAGDRRSLLRNRPHGEHVVVDRRQQHFDFSHLMTVYRDELTSTDVKRLARELGIPEQTLIGFEIGTGHDCLGHFWSIPEYDDNLRVIGIQRRYSHGEKLAIAGSSRGLVIPSGEWKSSEPIAVVEGFSDSAALHACGVQVVGRPSAFGGSVLLGGFLKHHPGPVIVVGENDQKVDGRWPGRDGAMSVASYLQQLGHNEVSVILPPADCKDARSVFLRYDSETTRAWLRGALR